MWARGKMHLLAPALLAPPHEPFSCTRCAIYQHVVEECPFIHIDNAQLGVAPVARAHRPAFVNTSVS